MKKLITLLVATTMLICAFSLVAFAADEEVVYVNGELYDGTFLEAMNANVSAELYEIKLGSDVVIDKSLPKTTDTNVVVDLDGHTITASTSLSFNRGTFTFKNGTVSQTAENQYVFTLVGHETNEKTVTLNLINLTAVNEISGRVLRMDSQTKGQHTVNLTNVTFRGIANQQRMFYMPDDDNNTLNIYSGTFNVKRFDYFNKVNVNIYGGTFGADVTTKVTLPEGYVSVANEDGTYTVKKAPVEVTEAVSTASYDDGKNANTVTKRFFVTIDSDQYAEAGFEITVDDYTFEIALDEIYSAVSVNGTEYVVDEGYILTGAIGDVPNDFDGDFVVKAYTVSFTGEKTYIAE